MLAFGIRYFNGWVAARLHPSSLEVEWPPHPGRVFMALAAAHFQTGRDPDERKALLWLESLEKDGEPAAPEIVSSEESQRAIVTQYVPVGDSAGPSKSLLQTVQMTRDRQPRTFARAWLHSDTVFMIWPDAEPDDATHSSLEGLCRKVTRIGHSTSMVQMWLAAPDEFGDANWIPDEDRAVVQLRLAPSGTLDYLERLYNKEAVEAYTALKVIEADAQNKKAQKAARKRLEEKFPDGAPQQLRPNLSVYRGYAPLSFAEPMAQTAGTIFSPHLALLEIQQVQGAYQQLGLACVLSVTSRWRDAVLSQSNDLAVSVRELLSGHDADHLPLEHPHVAFAPLAFVGHEHADGHLMGMGIVLPRELSADDRRGVLRGFGRVRELKLGRLGVWHLGAITVARPAWTMHREAWTAYPGGATEWSTVTPVVFDRHPKSKDPASYRQEAAALIGEACARIGLPHPSQVIVSPVSAHSAVPPSHAFPHLQRKDGSLRRHTHVILVFDEPVCGPILIGAGRYRGYGFFRPLAAPQRGRPEL